MSEKNNGLQTTTKTNTITNTKLLVATMVMLTAGGAALAAAGLGNFRAIVRSCTDSDGGINLLQAGYLNTVSQATGRSQIFNDRCQTNGQISEFYCQETRKGNLPRQTTVACPDGYSCSDGACVSATVASTTLRLSLSATTPQSKLITSDSVVDLAKWNLLASNGNARITQLYLANNTLTSPANNPDAIADPIIFHDYQLVVDGNVISATTTMINGKIRFDIVAGLSLDKDNTKEITVRTATADRTEFRYPGVSGAKIQLALYGISAVDSASGRRIEGASLIGAKATDDISALDSAFRGQKMTLYKAAPTLQTVSISGSLANGTRDLMKFKACAVGYDISLNKFTFDVMATRVTVVSNTLYLYDVTYPSNETQLNDLGGTLTSSTIWRTSGSGWTVNFNNQEVVVTLNTCRTFVLRGNVLGVNTGSSISTRLAGDAAIAAVFGTDATMYSASMIATDGANSDFIWSDRHDDSHSVNTSDWTNGFQVEGLPGTYTSFQVLAY